MTSKAKAGITDLPAEVLEIIFHGVDGKTFNRLSQVCKKWMLITAGLEKTFWKQACLSEIDVCTVEELIGRKYVYNMPQSSPAWKNAYKAWHLGQAVCRNESFRNSFLVSDDNPVTCVKVSGGWILTGHRGGNVYGWNQVTGTMCHVFTQHLVRVNDFVLVDLHKCGPYGFLDNPFDHHHIISVSNDSTVQVNSLLSYKCGLDDELVVAHHHSCSLTAVRLFGKLVAVACSDNTVLVFEMEYVTQPLHRLQLSLMHSVIGPAEILWTFGLWHHEFQCFTVSGVRKEFSSCDRQWKTVYPYLIPNYKALKRIAITGAFLFRNKTVFLLTANGSMLVSVDGSNYIKYPLMNTIKTAVVTVSLYGSVLALGGEAGHLFLYHVPDIADLLTLNLDKPAWSSYLSEASIVAIDILHSENSIVVAASTTHTVFILRW